MSDSLRTLLRSIAIGAPIVLTPVGLAAAPFLLGCGCPTSTYRERQEIRITDANRGADGRVISCESICNAQQPYRGVHLDSCDWVDTETVDEEHHARSMMSLAGTARIEVTCRRSDEGCVHEAMGALDAAHQAIHAPDEDLRIAMRSIAGDEARHALLSLDVDAWAQRRLGVNEAREIRGAKRDAVRALEDAPPHEICEVGLWGHAERVRLLA